jgi:hypothetical protein
LLNREAASLKRGSDSASVGNYMRNISKVRRFLRDVLWNASRMQMPADYYRHYYKYYG